VVGILQHASSLVGLVVLLIWFAAWYRRTLPARETYTPELSALTKISVVFGMVFLAFASGCPLGLFVLSYHSPPITRSFVAATLLEGVTMVFCIEMLMYGAAMTLSRHPRRVPVTHLNGPTAKS
jgi:RsiW-degrading membrane proteinase PrsW (M82 family)